METGPGLLYTANMSSNNRSPDDSRNVDATGIAQRLLALRLEHTMSKAELADRAGLSYRTIHDLESGKRTRVQEKTLMLITGALGVPYEAIFEAPWPGPDPAPATPPAPTRWPVFLGVGVLAVAALVFFLGRQALGSATWTQDKSRLTVFDGLFHLKVQDWRLEDEVFCTAKAPWSDRVLLVGLAGHTAAGGRLIAMDLLTGRRLWERRPDLDLLVEAFGPEAVLDGNFHCRDFLFPDVNGDGRPEILVRFGHSLWYPNALCLLDEQGALLGQYCVCGVVYDLAIIDTDGDGDDEIVGASTNNSPLYQGGMAFLLDGVFGDGATVDQCSHPGTEVKDTSRFRVVFPQFPRPFMDQLRAPRIEASRLRSYVGPNGAVQFTVDVGQMPNNILILGLDHELRLLQSSIGDAFLSDLKFAWPESLSVGTGPADPGWRQEWLSSRVRFEDGLPVPVAP